MGITIETSVEETHSSWTRGNVHVPADDLRAQTLRAGIVSPNGIEGPGLENFRRVHPSEREGLSCFRLEADGPSPAGQPHCPDVVDNFLGNLDCPTKPLKIVSRVFVERIRTMDLLSENNRTMLSASRERRRSKTMTLHRQARHLRPATPSLWKVPGDVRNSDPPRFSSLARLPLAAQVVSELGRWKERGLGHLMGGFRSDVTGDIRHTSVSTGAAQAGRVRHPGGVWSLSGSSVRRRSAPLSIPEYVVKIVTAAVGVCAFFPAPRQRREFGSRVDDLP